MTDNMEWEKSNQNQWNITQDITVKELSYKAKKKKSLPHLEKSARVEVIYKYLLNH